MNIDTTIAAAATPLVTGAVGIVRISGPRARDVLAACFAPAGKTPVAAFAPNRLYYGACDCGAFADNCLAVWFAGPRSYTGEDCAEVHCHGGVEVVRGVLRRVLAAGARLAAPGEFTRRAFLNGKMDLSACEGVGELIAAESAAEAGAAGRLMRGELAKRVVELQGRLTDLLSQAEVLLDAPEEDLPALRREEAAQILGELAEELAALEAGYDTGRKLKSGISAVLCGRTNAGKSSLFNALLGTDRAIVTPLPGTTRDTVDAEFEVEGVKVRVVDTAGVRESGDVVERLGVARTLEEIRAADVVLHLTEDGVIDLEDEEILRAAAGRPVIRIRSKQDGQKTATDSAKDAAVPDEAIPNKPGPDKTDPDAAVSDEADELLVSARSGRGLGALKTLIVRRALAGGVPSGLVLTNERHYDAVRRAGALARQAASEAAVLPLDLFAFSLRELWDVLGEITGTTATEDIIDNIFRKFCLGK